MIRELAEAYAHAWAWWLESPTALDTAALALAAGRLADALDATDRKDIAATRLVAGLRLVAAGDTGHADWCGLEVRRQGVLPNMGHFPADERHLERDWYVSPWEQPTTDDPDGPWECGLVAVIDNPYFEPATWTDTTTATESTKATPPAPRRGPGRPKKYAQSGTPFLSTGRQTKRTYTDAEKRDVVEVARQICQEHFRNGGDMAKLPGVRLVRAELVRRGIRTPGKTLLHGLMKAGSLIFHESRAPVARSAGSLARLSGDDDQRQRLR